LRPCDVRVRASHVRSVADDRTLTAPIHERSSLVQSEYAVRVIRALHHAPGPLRRDQPSPRHSADERWWSCRRHCDPRGRRARPDLPAAIRRAARPDCRKIFARLKSEKALILKIPKKQVPPEMHRLHLLKNSRWREAYFLVGEGAAVAVAAGFG